MLLLAIDVIGRSHRVLFQLRVRHPRCSFDTLCLLTRPDCFILVFCLKSRVSVILFSALVCLSEKQISKQKENSQMLRLMKLQLFHALSFLIPISAFSHALFSYGFYEEKKKKTIQIVVAPTIKQIFFLQHLWFWLVCRSINAPLRFWYILSLGRSYFHWKIILL